MQEYEATSPPPTGPAGSEGDPLLEGIVREVHSNLVRVRAGACDLDARTRGVLKGGRRKAANIVAVGDRVRVRRTEGRDAVVEEVLARTNRISRTDPGEGDLELVVAANLDLFVTLVSMDDPRFNPRALDRFLVLGESAEIPCAVVLNKIDLVRDEPDILESAKRLYRSIGYPVYTICARSGEGCDALRADLEHKVSLVLGPSGVGKSTLLNRLVPGIELRTSPVSRATSKGVHTTTRVEWVDLPGGGAVLDSPGIRSIQPYGLEAAGLACCFPEFRRLPACRFDDCLHRGEPGCAVVVATESGRIDPSRRESYLRILETLTPR